MRFPLVSLLCLLPALAFAQDDPVAVTFSVDRQVAGPGETVEVRASVVVEEGWHVYGPTEAQGIPTAFEVKAEGLGAAKAPTAEAEEVPYMGTMHLLRGSFVFSQAVTLSSGASGPVSIPLRFTYQACSEGENSVCLPPETREETVSVNVVSPAATAPPFAATPFAEGGAQEGPKATVTFSVSPNPARPGAVVEVRAEVVVAEGWHVYGAGETNGIPSKLSVDAGPFGALQGPPGVPEPHIEEAEFVGKLQILRGSFAFTQAVRLSPDAQGTLSLTAAFESQACSEGENSVCLEAETATGSLTLEVAGEPVTTAPVEPPPPITDDSMSNPLNLIGAAIALGFAMLAFPCTYPMIPITVSLFSKGKSLPRHQVVWRAFVYAAGIVLSFVAVGGLVQVLLQGQGQAAVQTFATNAWVNLVIGAIFVYFAFSFFGYYELGMPGWMQNLMQKGGATRDSDGTVPTWSLFMMGLFFVLTSYTCGAPVVFTLFASAAQHPHPFAILGATFVFAVTVAAPFFLLAVVPSAMRHMPKSGSWFTVFKVVLGFVELGFAVKFFRGTDLQWDFLNLLTRPVTLSVWIALCLAAAVYLVGFFPITFPHSPKLRVFSAPRTVWALVFVAAAGYFGYGLAGNELYKDVEAFILADHEKGEEEGTVMFGLPYYTSLDKLEEVKAAAKAKGEPVFLMFTGHNCVNCVQMEKGVLPREPVTKRLEGLGRVALFIDKAGDPAEEAHKALMIESFNDSGTIPAFYVIDGDGKVLSSVLGSVSPEAFQAFLDQGGVPK